MNAPVDERRAADWPLIDMLRCPYCGSPLNTVLTMESGRMPLPGQGSYAVLRCECAEYPVLEGIPILQQLDGLSRVIQLLKKGDATAALLRAMNVFRITWAHRTRLHQASYYLNSRRLVHTPGLTFEDALQLVRKPVVFADYLLHRYANPSFLSDVALMPVLAAYLDGVPRGGTARPRVLDLGCGAGHSSFLISSLLPDVALTASDQDFVSLYLAKRFMVPHADFVCVDVEAPSPFPDAWFDAVHCLDAFHYFRSKRAIVGELERVVRRGGLWVFPHLHNALQPNVTAGVPLTPAHYARCFERIAPTLVDEAHLLASRADVSRAPFCDGRSVDQLRTAQTVALVGGAPCAVGAAQPLLPWLRRLGSTLRVNPIYRGRQHGETLQLQLRWPNERLHEECRAVEAILPATCEVTKTELAAADRGDFMPASRLEALLTNFVLVPLPPHYTRRDLKAVLGRSS